MLRAEIEGIPSQPKVSKLFYIYDTEKDEITSGLVSATIAQALIKGQNSSDKVKLCIIPSWMIDELDSMGVIKYNRNGD